MAYKSIPTITSRILHCKPLFHVFRDSFCNRLSILSFKCMTDSNTGLRDEPHSHLACDEERHEVCRLLIAVGASLSVQNKVRNPLLFLKT